MPYTEEYYEKKPNYEELAKKLMRLFGKDEQNSEFKGFVAALEPDQLAGVYHYLHDEGGLGKLEGNTLAQIASGTLQNRNPKYIQAAIALRVMMDEIPGSHRARHSMIDYPPGHGPNPQEPGEPWSPEMQQYLASRKKQFGDYKQRKGLQEGTNMKLTKTYIMKVIKEEIQNVLDEATGTDALNIVRTLQGKEPIADKPEYEKSALASQAEPLGTHTAYTKKGDVAATGAESEKLKQSVPLTQTPATAYTTGKRKTPMPQSVAGSGTKKPQ